MPVVYTDAEGNDVTIKSDSVVSAMGSRLENSLAKVLEDSGFNVTTIGDANRCGKIGDALDDGFALACRI